MLMFRCAFKKILNTAEDSKAPTRVRRRIVVGTRYDPQRARIYDAQRCMPVYPTSCTGWPPWSFKRRRLYDNVNQAKYLSGHGPEIQIREILTASTTIEMTPLTSL